MNLEEYKEKHPNYKDILTKREKSTKIAEMFVALEKNEAIKLIVKDLTDIINTINTKLLSDDELSTEERNCLIIDRSRCMWFGEIFKAQKQIIENTKSFIEKL